MQIAPFINAHKLLYSAKTNLLMTSWLNVSRGASPARRGADGQRRGNFQTTTAPNIRWVIMRSWNINHHCTIHSQDANTLQCAEGDWEFAWHTGRERQSGHRRVSHLKHSVSWKHFQTWTKSRTDIDIHWKNTILLQVEESSIYTINNFIFQKC